MIFILSIEARSPRFVDFFRSLHRENRFAKPLSGIFRARLPAVAGLALWVRAASAGIWTSTIS
jgi:hypothetical protein